MSNGVHSCVEAVRDNFGDNEGLNNLSWLSEDQILKASNFNWLMLDCHIHVLFISHRSFRSLILRFGSVLRSDVFQEARGHFPAFGLLRHADSMYVYHYTLAFEPDFYILVQ